MILSTASIGGIAIGSLVSGSILKNGRIKIITVCNIVSIISTFLSIWLNWELMLAARFVFAFSAGIAGSACPKMIEETIPAHLIEKGFGQSTNTIICFCFFLTLLASFGTPLDTQELKESDYWMVFYLIPAPFLFISLATILFCHNHESLTHLVKKNEKD